MQIYNWHNSSILLVAYLCWQWIIIESKLWWNRDRLILTLLQMWIFFVAYSSVIPGKRDIQLVQDIVNMVNMDDRNLPNSVFLNLVALCGKNVIGHFLARELTSLFWPDSTNFRFIHLFIQLVVAYICCECLTKSCRSVEDNASAWLQIIYD